MTWIASYSKDVSARLRSCISSHSDIPICNEFYRNINLDKIKEVEINIG